ncbi:MAG: MOSC domain-containing protein [Deltaproteobacteria bacterium]|nr:MOSC domain-containing protein [Deltaproteobacteria bacterium]
MAVVVRIQVSLGGVPKQPVPRAVVGPLGIEGDAVAHPQVHGGPERAVCLFAEELIQRLRGEGHPIQPGDLGENLLLRGVDWTSLHAGHRLRIGAKVELELTRPTTPCGAIAGAFTGGDFSRVAPDRHPGEHRWYARVLRGGVIEVGDEVTAQAVATTPANST